MSKKMIFTLAIFLLIIYGCQTQQTVFEQSIGKINEIDKKYDASLKIPPNTTVQIGGLAAELSELKNSGEMPESVTLLLDFKLKFLEAEKLNAEGWQWGKGSTTQYGFGCKGYERIKQSASLRKQSAQKGYEAAAILNSFIEKYPEEAKSLNLTKIEAMTLNAEYFKIEEAAVRDDKVIENFCGAKAKGNLTQ